jgi:hypothetical protein
MVGQSGNVWFLTAKWGKPPITAYRQCRIPVDKYLFFPIANGSNDNWTLDSAGALDWADNSTDDLRQALKGFLDGVVSMSCYIDGRLVRHLESVKTTPYRVTSPVFHYAVPRDNIQGIPVSTPPGKVGVPGVVGDGVYLMLEPLAPGHHTIRMAASFGTDPGAYSFDITYAIVVQ